MQGFWQCTRPFQDMQFQAGMCYGVVLHDCGTNVMRIPLKVVPGASCDEISGWLGDSLKVRVRAVAEAGKANAAVTRVVALRLGVPLQTVRIVSGTASAHKVLEVDDLSMAKLRERLACTAD